MGPDASWRESAEHSWLASRVALARIAGLPDSDYIEQALRGVLFPDRVRPSMRYSDEASLNSRVDEVCRRIGVSDCRPWPTPLACALRDLIDEREGSWMRLAGRVRDILEVFVKYAAAIALCDVLDRSVPVALRDELARSITRPSLGHWIFYGRSAAEAFGAAEYFVPGIPVFFRDRFGSKANEIAAYRNAQTHGATRSEGEYAREFETGLELLFFLLPAGMDVWKGIRLLGFDEAGPVLGEGCDPARFTGFEGFPEGSVVLIPTDSLDRHLDLSPLLAYRPCRAPTGLDGTCGRRQFLFFNDRKSDKAVTFLDYPLGHLGRDHGMLQAFENRFQLWIHRGHETFEGTILDRTDDFVGREDEIDSIRRYVRDRQRGAVLLTGPPGTGKSALMSALCRIGSETLVDDFEGPNYAALLGAKDWGDPAVVRYFVKRGALCSDSSHFLTTILVALGRLFETSPNLSGDGGDLFREFEHQLELASRAIHGDGSRFKRLLFLIDGLDESLSEGGADRNSGIAACIPRRLPNGVHFVVSSRPCAAADGLAASWTAAAEPFETVELGGLDQELIAEYLRRTVSHFGVGTDYVTSVHRASEGNPHYLKLLAEELVEGRRRPDRAQIPASVEELYRDIRERLANDGGQPALDLLTTLALAREMFSLEDLAQLLGDDLAGTSRLLTIVSEVLNIRRGADGRTHYGLFHDKFREFLRDDPDRKQHSEEIARRMLRRLCEGDRGEPIGAGELDLVNRLLSGGTIRPAEAPALASLGESAARTLTGFHLLKGRLAALEPDVLRDLLPLLADHVGPGGARLLTEIVEILAHRTPSTAIELLGRLIAMPEGADDTSKMTCARIALESALATSGIPELAAAARRTCLSACLSSDDNVKALGVFTLFRLRKSRHVDGIEVLRELSERALVAGIPIPSRMIPYVSAVLGMFFEESAEPRLREDLGRLVRGTIDRFWWKGLLLVVGPRVAAHLLSTGIDDFNPINLGEIKHHKRFMATHPEMAASIERMLRFVDPRRGSDDEFDRAVQSFYVDSGGVRDGFAMYALQAAVTARTLNGREAALESSWKLSSTKQPGDHAAPQDFLFQLRITQLGKKIRNQPPLGRVWTDRAEEAARRFFYDHGAIYRIGHPYVGGGLIPGTVFLAHQTGSGQVDLLREFIDWTYGEERNLRADAGRSRNQRPDAVVLRVLEVVGLEYGSYDALAGDAARFGLGEFLDHAASFDTWTWDRIVTILARMRTYAPEKVDRFLADRGALERQKLEARLQRTLPKERLDTLLSMRTEFLYAQALGEGPDEPGGLRPEWCRFLRTLLGRQSPAGTYRDLGRRLLHALET